MTENIASTGTAPQYFLEKHHKIDCLFTRPFQHCVTVQNLTIKVFVCPLTNTQHAHFTFSAPCGLASLGSPSFHSESLDESTIDTRLDKQLFSCTDETSAQITLYSSSIYQQPKPHPFNFWWGPQPWNPRPPEYRSASIAFSENASFVTALHRSLPHVCSL